MLARVIGFEKQAARYQGDLNEIALFPYNGLTTSQRVSMLEDHYRRTAYREPLNPFSALSRSALKGALIGSAAVMARQVSLERQAGTGLRKSFANALHAAKWPAPLVGATIAAPLGLIPVIRDRVEIAKAKGVISMSEKNRSALLHHEVMRALR